MTKHTQGTWIYQHRSNEQWIEHISELPELKRINICDLSKCSDADARLMASAPKLLEALKEAQSYILRSKSFKIKDSNCFHIAVVMNQAISKAEGKVGR